MRRFIVLWVFPFYNIWHTERNWRCNTVWKVSKCGVFFCPVNLFIPSEYGKMQTRKSYISGHITSSVDYKLSINWIKTNFTNHVLRIHWRHYNFHFHCIPYMVQDNSTGSQHMFHLDIGLDLCKHYNQYNSNRRLKGSNYFVYFGDRISKIRKYFIF